MDTENKAAVAQNFYNDTYFSDQNACTSPRIVVWAGKQREAAKKLFWDELHKLVEEKYTFQAITGVHKLTSSYLIAVDEPGMKIEKRDERPMTTSALPTRYCILSITPLFKLDCISIASPPYLRILHPTDDLKVLALPST